MSKLLQVDDLSITFPEKKGEKIAVNHASFSLEKGETLALVGESGSGKTLAALSILGLLPPRARVLSGTILFRQKSLLTLENSALQTIRGREIAMVFQEPMTALNPVRTIHAQLLESLALTKTAHKSLFKEALQLLEQTGIGEPERVIHAYPHQLSGGQRQRAMIAMALAGKPDILIADEPTTALDVTIQAQILTLLKSLQKRFKMAMLLISHDLPMVERIADRIAVMKQGQIVETESVKTIFDFSKSALSQRHPYTEKLLTSLPKNDSPQSKPERTILYQAKDICCHFITKKSLFGKPLQTVKAVQHVNATLYRGETLGIVGESGSGKSTFAEALLRLNHGTGDFIFNQVDLMKADQKTVRNLRQKMQVVFQDPFSSLSPRMSIGEILEEGVITHKLESDPSIRRQKAIAVLHDVGLEGDILERYPHQFSGGQRQRIAIARTLMMEPNLIVLDEPTSALDLSVQSQILTLLERLQKQYGLSYLFISHDLRVIRALSHETMVMKGGCVVEYGATAQIFSQPKHPYTQQLLTAALGRV
ncbi:ABC transporter ATP-binding protein [Magnetococcales bacterium HHB-1]